MRTSWRKPPRATARTKFSFSTSATNSAKARAAIFFSRAASILLTPPLSCGLLPGTLRARLLAEGRAREAILRLEDLAQGEFLLGNSVRGLVRARLIC